MRVLWRTGSGGLGMRTLMLCFLILCLPVVSFSKEEDMIRAPYVAGQFYSSNAQQLKKAIELYLAHAPVIPGAEPVGLIAPHAGYVYSGQIAADAYRQAQGHDYDVVVILGTNHTRPGFSGVSIYARGGFQTPLGTAYVDEALAEALLKEDERFVFDSGVHREEHSVEVQVPFIQYLFPKVRILPVVIGEPDEGLCKAFGQALAKVLKGRRPLIVASSDLSHYPAHDDAVRVDMRTLRAAASLEPSALLQAVSDGEREGVRRLGTCACGEGPILALMEACKGLGARQGVVVSYANSGDVSMGDYNRVVGYGAVAFLKGPVQWKTLVPSAMEQPVQDAVLTTEDKKALLKFARDTLEQFLSTQTAPIARGFGPGANVVRGAFVTLKKHGDLRGCIGNMQASFPLARTVGAMALSAALNDPRFHQVSYDELSSIQIEISALTPFREVSGVNEIVVGRDGVLLVKGGASAVFLPQVAPEQGWDRDTMLSHLCRKAGMNQDCWRSGARFYTFQAEIFEEEHK
jgi:AmmeMemoRadiSam system protein B/AmmeMemoRadiSam system protein A